MSNTGTVLETETKNGTDEASTRHTDVISTQKLVESMVAKDKALGHPAYTLTPARFANFQSTQNTAAGWPSVRDDMTREPAFRKLVETVIESLEREVSHVSYSPKPWGEW